MTPDERLREWEQQRLREWGTEGDAHALDVLRGSSAWAIARLNFEFDDLGERIVAAITPPLRPLVSLVLWSASLGARLRHRVHVWHVRRMVRTRR